MEDDEGLLMLDGRRDNKRVREFPRYIFFRFMVWQLE